MDQPTPRGRRDHLGNVTGNIWASENNMSANVASGDCCRCHSRKRHWHQELEHARRRIAFCHHPWAEVAVTTRAVRNASASIVGATLNRGDRLRVRVMDAGVSTSGFTWNIGYNGTAAAADGDTYVTFTENFSFESAPGSTSAPQSAAFRNRFGFLASDDASLAVGFTATGSLLTERELLAVQSGSTYRQLHR